MTADLAPGPFIGDQDEFKVLLRRGLLAGRGTSGLRGTAIGVLIMAHAVCTSVDGLVGGMGLSPHDPIAGWRAAQGVINWDASRVGSSRAR